jgi:hypothetical protein
MSNARMSRRDLLRRGAFAAGAVAAAPVLGGVRPAFGATPAITMAADNLSFARVWARTAKQAAALASFDDTHAVFADGSVELLLWPGDRRKLDSLGVDYELFTPRQGAPALSRSTLGLAAQPGERTAYRRLGDYITDIQALATAHPVQAQAFTMPERSLEGRQVWGIEIADDLAKARVDGRPVFWVDGVHHSREWPSSELTMMFAFDLLESFGKDARVSDLMTKLRFIIVPVMNPDGFNHSREALVDNSTADAGQQFAYWRKNKRSVTGLLYGMGQTSGHLNADAHGTDPNRNYPFYWGGEGGGGDPTSQTYGGSAPYAEPESRNVAGLMKANQVTAYLTNHTHGKLCMRPWGFTNEPSPDDEFQTLLGEQMCEFHRYNNQIGLSLYPTAGTSRDWSYAALRTIVYTFEHLRAFHPDYVTNIPGAYAENRPAWLLLAEAAADPANHMVLTGRVVNAAGAPVAGEKVTLFKSFNTPTHVEVKALQPNKGVAEVITTVHTTRADGTFEIHANPSTRPFTIMAAGDREFWTVTVGNVTKQAYGERGDKVDLGQITV